MQLGIFTKVFVRPTLEETFDAVRASGLAVVQFNFASAGMASMPERIEPELIERIRHACQTRGIVMTSLSGTYNMAHPHADYRQAGLRRLGLLAAVCRGLGTSAITLCTGTRDPENMWRRHPANDSPEAWDDMLASMRAAVALAEQHGVTLAIEPEVANVVDSAAKARRLLDQVGSPRLKVVIDPANLFHAGELPRMREVLTAAFDLLGPDIIMAHAKDLSRDGEAGHEAAGMGLLDYDLYLDLLRQSNFRGPLLLHGLAEFQVPQCLAFLRAKLAAAL